MVPASGARAGRLSAGAPAAADALHNAPRRGGDARPVRGHLRRHVLRRARGARAARRLPRLPGRRQLRRASARADGRGGAPLRARRAGRVQGERRLAGGLRRRAPLPRAFLAARQDGAVPGTPRRRDVRVRASRREPRDPARARVASPPAQLLAPAAPRLAVRLALRTRLCRPRLGGSCGGEGARGGGGGARGHARVAGAASARGGRGGGRGRGRGRGRGCDGALCRRQRGRGRGRVRWSALAAARLAAPAAGAV
mmetsp:Transcript_14767/g.47447  ORF Transcript_14767/g.47447 Transcript_14767/m.47447 type:complete len:255 (-) Transcript_14767:1274-2038(-)